MNKKTKSVLIGLVIFILGFFLYSYQNINAKVPLGVEKDNELLLYFIEHKTEYDVITCGYEDLNDDGRKDLLVIYKVGLRENGMLIVLDTVDGYKFTDSVRAPIDNQKIEFKDIDKTGPIEFIISGSKDGNFGYSIFRLIDDVEIRDLFGEGMEDCC